MNTLRQFRGFWAVVAALVSFGGTAFAQSLQYFEPSGASTAGLRYTRAGKVSPDGVAIVGTTTATGYAGEQGFIWRAGPELLLITNANTAGEFWQSITEVDVANGGNRAVFRGFNGAAGEGYRGLLWTRTNGLQSIGQLTNVPVNNSGRDDYVYPAAISANGQVIVGRARSPNTTVQIENQGGAIFQTWEAFRWTAEAGMAGLGDVMGDPAVDLFDSHAVDVSTEGRIILGFVRYGGPSPLSPLGYHAPARWVDGSGPQMLPPPPAFKETSVGRALSPNGTYVVGSYEFGGERRPGSTLHEDLVSRAFRWSEQEGYTILQEGRASEVSLGVWSSRSIFLPNAVSDDGRVVVGTLVPEAGRPGGAAIWTADRGLRLLGDVLAELGVALGAYPLTAGSDVSADGRVIVGTAQDSLGAFRAFRAVLWELPPRKIVVNSLADRPALSDANCCDTGEKLPNGDPECTLRAALEAVNAGCGDRIEFAVPDVALPKIAPQSPLPALLVPADLDGTTQTGGRVEISGTDSTGIALDLRGGNSTVRGLVINGFTGANGGGIRLSGGGNNTIVGNYLGTDLSGSAAAPNVINLVITNSSNNQIGTTEAGDGNIVADTLIVSGEASTGNSVVANRIGIGADGVSRIGKNLGIEILAGSGTHIGGGPGAGNTIGGISEFGILIVGGRDTVVEGNRVGLDFGGTRALGGEIGIAAGSRSDPGIANLIIRSNRVAGVRAGILVLGQKVAGAMVTDNIVGTRFDGSGNLPTGVEADYARFGIRVDGAPSVQVFRNVVVGADMNLLIAGKPQFEYSPCEDTDGDGECDTASEVTFYSPENPWDGDGALPQVGGVVLGGNTIGLNERLAVPTGARQRFGVTVYRGARDLQIRNSIVAGHSEGDVWLRDGARLQLMQNRIGSPDGISRNSQIGVIVDETLEVTMGPQGNFVGNTLSFQKKTAVLVRSGATNVLIRQNQIGTGPGGAVAWPNGSGVIASGVNITGLRIEDNLINGSVTNAVWLEVPDKVVLSGNRIGVSSAGLGLSNRVGVMVRDTPVELRENIIAHNGVGIVISGDQSALVQGGPLYENGDGTPEAAVLYLDQSLPIPAVFVIPKFVSPAGKVQLGFLGEVTSASGGDVELEVYGNRTGERQGRTPLARRTVRANEKFDFQLEGEPGSAFDTLPEFTVTATQSGRTSTPAWVRPIRVEAKPVVTATSATDITLQWPAAIPFVLERAAAPTGPWSQVLMVPQIGDGTASLTLPLEGDSQFFRLVLGNGN